MNREELRNAIENKYAEINNLRKQIHALKEEFCEKNAPLKNCDEIEVNGRKAIVDNISLDDNYEYVCYYNFEEDDEHWEEEWHAIYEKDFDKIKKL